MSTFTSTGVRERVDGLDWAALREQLDTQGHAITAPLVEAGECEALSDLFDGGRFRSTVRVGMRHGVATVTRGGRTALGVIFHDAR